MNNGSVCFQDGGPFGVLRQGCEIKSLDEIKELLVADQVKGVMHANTRAYVELKETQIWLKPQEVAELAVKYERTYWVESITQAPVAKVGGSGKGKYKPKYWNTGSVLRVSEERKCFFCKEIAHFKAHYPKCEKPDAKGGVGARTLTCEQVGETGWLPSASKVTKVTQVESGVRCVELKSDEMKFMGRLDSGADIKVTRRSVLSRTTVEEAGMIKLQAAFRRPETADVNRSTCRLRYTRSRMTQCLICNPCVLS